ncbi:hypothetical protein AVEN_11616-1 [Araneus ventricosus]|uniref:Uncharacterized protein n=1 Tax=Araneus ventricosus TaxID=182803 RepID=A0A4Y2SAS0_ARAVE|nr:hypothetical protein AVEN_11616-1 [Araneus ventricosus]
MLVLWLGREFYRDKYGMTAAARPGPLTMARNLTTILATSETKCGTSKMKEFSRYLYQGPRSGFIQMIPCDVKGKNIKGPRSDDRARACVDQLGSPSECERLWDLSLEFYSLCELISR